MISIWRHQDKTPPDFLIGEKYPSGVLALDNVCGGLGLTAGETIEWQGSRSCGKTAALRSFIQNARLRGISVAWIDSHHQLMPHDWSGEYPGRFWVVRPPRINECIVCAEALIRTESFGLIIVDGDVPIKGNLPARLRRLARKTHTCLVFVNGFKKTGLDRVNSRVIFKSEVVRASKGLAQRVPYRWLITMKNDRVKGVDQERRIHVSESVISRMSDIQLGADRSANRTSHLQRYRG